MKILFITAHRLGDAVLSTAVLSYLHDHYPDARFTIVCGPAVADIFTRAPRCDAVIALTKKSYNRHWLSLWTRCVAQRWFMVVDLRSSLVSYGLWVRRRVVVKGGRRPGHKIIQHAQALGTVGTLQPCLWFRSAVDAQLSRELPPHKQWVALAPTAGSPVKAWPAQSFAALARELEDCGLHPVIFYGPGEVEREHARPLLQALPHAIDVGGRYGLNDVACLLRHCRLFVGNDSGLMHMAAALGVPTVGLFGPSCVSQYAPVGPHVTTVCAPGVEGAGNMVELDVSAVKKAVFRLYRKTTVRALEKEMNDAL